MNFLIALPVGLGVGVVLGMLGAGGSLLTVPALIFLLGLTTVQATGTSLLAVSVMAVAGLYMHRRAGRCRCKHGMMFAATGMVTAAVTGRYASSLPESVLTLSFAVLLLGTAVWLILRKEPKTDPAPEEQELVTARAGAAPAARPATVGRAADSAGEPLPTGTTEVVSPDDVADGHAHGEVQPWKVFASGAGVGVLTGVLGVGGGFLIVPALMVTLGMAMPMAVGTSQLVVLTNALAGLAGRASGGGVEWALGAAFGLGGVFGAVIGSKIADRVSSDVLTKTFAVIAVVVAAAMFGRALL